MYKSGFCTSQSAYEQAQRELYSAMDGLEHRLSQHRFLLGDRQVPFYATQFHVDLPYLGVHHVCNYCISSSQLGTRYVPTCITQDEDLVMSKDMLMTCPRGTCLLDKQFSFDSTSLLHGSRQRCWLTLSLLLQVH